MPRKLSPFEDDYEAFEKDEGIHVKVMVPLLKEETGFSRCVLEMQTYHDVEDDHSHYVLFWFLEGDEDMILDAFPIGYTNDDIIFCESVGDDGEVECDLIMDLTKEFYSTDSVLEMNRLRDG